MTITCPHCDFAKEVDPASLPDKPLKVTCPRCKEVFGFQKPASNPVLEPPKLDQEPAINSPPVVPVNRGPQRVCSACGTVQQGGSNCTSCGATFVAMASLVDGHQYAGFWIRFVAVVIDSLLVTVVQAVCGFFLGLVGGSMANEDMLLVSVSFMFGSVISIAYYVFFTGYCGQTPGKMALRIKVIRTDGSDISYGRAFLREAVGKFISALILFIGYLMAAFDSQKQGLHDRMADTYVIKL